MKRSYAVALLVVDVVVFILAIGWVDSPVLKVLICVGAGLSAIVTAAILRRPSRDPDLPL